MLGFDGACNRQRRTLTWRYLGVESVPSVSASGQSLQVPFSTYPTSPKTSSARCPCRSWGRRRGPAGASVSAGGPFVRCPWWRRNRQGTIRLGRPSPNRRNRDRDCRAVRNEDGSRPGQYDNGCLDLQGTGGTYEAVSHAVCVAFR